MQSCARLLMLAYHRHAQVLDSRGKAVRPVVVKDGEHAMKLAGAALQVHFDSATLQVAGIACAV